MQLNASRAPTAPSPTLLVRAALLALTYRYRVWLLRRLDDISVLLGCPKLLHANVAYNRLALLRMPPRPALCAPLLSLDLSHNNLCHLPSLLEQLRQLPTLQVLALAGNPLCLQHGYRDAVRKELPGLKYLDGRKIDLMERSRSPPPQPPSPKKSSRAGSRSSSPQRSRAPSARRRSRGDLAEASEANAQEEKDEERPIMVVLDLGNLEVLEDPFADVKAQWAVEAAAAEAAAAALLAAGGKASSEPAASAPGAAPKPPMHPVYYHFEMVDPEGAICCSLPIKVSRRTPWQAAA